MLENPVKTSAIRRILPQVIAANVKNFLIFDYGLSMGIIAIIIPALCGLDEKLNPNEMVQISAFEASWLGSLPYLFKLSGSFLSGYVAETLGRKKALFVVNVPFALAWWMLYRSSTFMEIIIGNAVLGLAVGLLKTPTMTYVSESCEASVRGTLNATEGLAGAAGALAVFILANFTDWRTVSLCCFAIPIVTMAAVCFIPESPMWLLSRHREKEALRSLQYLRGWVPEKVVQSEFETMKHHQKLSTSCPACQKLKQKCFHPPPTMMEKIKELTRKKTLKPGLILLIAYSMAQTACLTHLLPFIVQIMNAYQPSVNPRWGTVIITASAICGTTTIILTVKTIGKRRIYLFSLAGASITYFLLSAYGFYKLPTGITSFASRGIPIDPETASILPTIAFTFLRFCTSGISMIPVIMFGELFPFKTRSLATGITAAFSYVIIFIANKSFVNVENLLSLPGAMAFYGGIGAIGWFVTYNILPETEKRTMHEIETHFSNNKLKLTDRKIASVATISTSQTWRVDLEKTSDDRAIKNPKGCDNNDRSSISTESIEKSHL